LKLLPKEYWHLELAEDKKRVVAGIYEHPKNTIYYVLYDLSDLPNSLISHDDLERFGINASDK
jgi:hypothetical protein